MISNILRIFLLFSLATSIQLSAQLKVRLGVESGWFNSESDALNSNKDFIARLTGSFKYKYTDKNKTARADLKIQPGFLGADFGADFLKYKATGNYFHRLADWGWGINISTQKNIYYESETYHHLTNTVEFIGSYRMLKTGTSIITVGYADQQVSFSGDQALERIFVSAGLNVNIIKKISLGARVYFEDYNLESHSNLFENIDYKNHGYRLGPAFSAAYLDEFSLRINYSLIYQKSDVLDESTYEHKLRIVAGKIIGKWSLFAMMDFTDYVLDYLGTAAEETDLLRFPANYENNFYIKAAREISRPLSVYGKLGYFNENVKYGNFSFSGWNFLIGIEIAN